MQFSERLFMNVLKADKPKGEIVCFQGLTKSESYIIERYNKFPIDVK
jgi:hypothetical protein